jgi:hypothetical protein
MNAQMLAFVCIRDWLESAEGKKAVKSGLDAAVLESLRLAIAGAILSAISEAEGDRQAKVKAKTSRAATTLMDTFRPEKGASTAPGTRKK